MRYAAGVAALNVQRLKFLVFESLASPAVQLRRSLASLVTIFGAAVLPGVVVVASQADLRTGPAREVRLQALRAVMAEQGVAQLVVWQHGESLDAAGVQAELAELQAALRQVPGEQGKSSVGPKCPSISLSPSCPLHRCLYVGVGRPLAAAAEPCAGALRSPARAHEGRPSGGGAARTQA